MLTLCDYHVLTKYFCLKGSPSTRDHDQRRFQIRYDTPLSVVSGSDLGRSPILAFTAHVRGGDLVLSVKVNGNTQKSLWFHEGQTATYHFVLDGIQTFQHREGNIIEFSVSTYRGTAEISDVVLWFQRNVP